jgi:DNA polymerase III delta prime subunit
MANSEHSMWVERYRPDTLDGFVGNAALKQTIGRFIESGDIPHLLFSGKAGTGKTTLAKIIHRNIECDVLELNASDFNGVDVVRDKIRGFVSTMSFSGGLKVVFLDEFDGFTRQGQESLRNLMEVFSDNSRFILTCNYVERVIEPILSRTQQFVVEPMSKKDVAMHMAGILQKEGVSFTGADLKLLVEAHFPDVRKLINECSLRSGTGTLTIDQKELVENDSKLKVVAVLGSADNPRNKFQTVRQLVANSGLRDFSDFYRMLFDHVDDFGRDHVSACILAIADGQARDAVVVDKEINAMATLINILQLIG